MTSIRKFAYAALLAASTLTLGSNAAWAQEPARGHFSLTHDVHWGSMKVPAGDYAFTFDPDSVSRVLILTRMSGPRASFMLLVPAADDTKNTGLSRLVLEATPEGSYVSTMQLPEFRMTLHFAVPSHVAERQVARAANTASTGQ